MQLSRAARWLLPALLLCAVSTLSCAGVLKGVGVSRHVLPALGQAAAPAEAPAAPQAPQKAPANRKHLNVRVGPLRMHIPVSGKRPLPTATGSNGQPEAEKTTPSTIKGNDQQAYQPPQAIDPANGLRRGEDIQKPIMFRWTPVIPRPQGQVTYRVSVWQLMQGQTGVEAMKANQPILTKDVDNITELEVRNLPAAGCGPPNACGYVWNVQALDRNRRPIGGENGVIAASAFRYEAQGENSGPRQPVAQGIFDRWGNLYVDSRSEQKATAGAAGQPGQVDLEAGQLKQNPKYVRVGENPATGTNGNPQERSDAIKANTPIVERSGVTIRGSSGTPPIESMKANQPILTKDVGEDETRIQNPVLDGHSIKVNTPILTKDVGEQGRINPAIEEGRSVTAPGTGKPQPADNPITAINITLPANPDAAKKVNGSANGGTGAHPANQFIITKYNGLDEENKATGVTGAVPTAGDVVVVGYGTQQPGQERDIINKGLPITNKNIVRTEPMVTGASTGAKPDAPAIYDHGGYTHVEQGGTMTGIQERPTPPQPGQERDIINKGLPITNKNIDRTEPKVTGTGTGAKPDAPGIGDRWGNTVVTEGTPVVSPSEYRTVTTDKLQGPEGALVQPQPKPLGTTNGESAPPAKPAKKKSKIGIHVTF